MAAVAGQRINEPVAVPAVHNGFYPKVFVWRGKRHDVHLIESCRTSVRQGWRGRMERHHFRVRSEGAVFELSQDQARDTWLLERVWGG